MIGQPMLPLLEQSLVFAIISGVIAVAVITAVLYDRGKHRP